MGLWTLLTCFCLLCLSAWGQICEDVHNANGYIHGLRSEDVLKVIVCDLPLAACCTCSCRLHAAEPGFPQARALE